MKTCTRVALALACGAMSVPASAQTFFVGAGPTTTTAVNDFRTALGGGTTAGANGTFTDATGARREINWDGAPDPFAAPNNLPANFFNLNSPRGVVLSTPGTGFQVSANAATGVPVEFGNLNPTYPGTFTTFSAQRLFTAIDSNITDVTFFIPGTNTPAFTDGFGAVFSDVDLFGPTTLTFFGAGGVLLGTWPVPAFPSNETLSFLGVLFDAPIVSSVRITAGTIPLGPNALDMSTGDVVAMDDFIFGEPTLPGVPEPGTWLLLLSGFAAVGFQLRRRRAAVQRAG